MCIRDRLKAEGVIAGVSDLILLKSNRDYGALLIEMKKKGGYQSPSQKQWQKMICENREYKYVVCPVSYTHLTIRPDSVMVAHQLKVVVQICFGSQKQTVL